MTVNCGHIKDGHVTKISATPPPSAFHRRAALKTVIHIILGISKGTLNIAVSEPKFSFYLFKERILIRLT